jgi:hypothetical protein
MKATHYRNNTRQMPVCAGLHPGGGFVAWPEDTLSPEMEKEQHKRRQRCRKGHGFIAWPEKDSKAC